MTWNAHGDGLPAQIRSTNSPRPSCPRASGATEHGAERPYFSHPGFIGLAEGDGVMAAVGAAIGLGGSAAVLYALLVIAPAVFGTP